jgi:hypothetical protein
MSNRFSHIKRKAEKNALDEFIENANQEDELLTKPRANKRDILLSVTGKINREEECEKPILLYIKKSIISEVKKYCHGNKTSIINYLLQLGIDTLKKDNKLILHIEDNADSEL